MARFVDLDDEGVEPPLDIRIKLDNPQDKGAGDGTANGREPPEPHEAPGAVPLPQQARSPATEAFQCYP